MDRQPLNLLDDDAVTQYIRYVRDLEKRYNVHFGLHVFDTYSQCISGADENSQATASKASSNMIRIRRELQTTVVYVHHTGKDENRGMRGSDALRANTDGAIEITLDDGGMAATAVVKRSKDAPMGGRMRFKMRFQKVPHLAGHEFDGSLVPEFVEEVPIDNGTPLPKSGRIITPLEDVLNHMEIGQTCSVIHVLKMTGKHDNKTYKDRLAKLLPMNMEMAVVNADGDTIGRLARVQGARSDNKYGDITCLAKGNNPTPSR